MTLSGEHSKGLKYQQPRNRWAWSEMTTKGQIGPLCCHGPEASLWPGMWQYQTLTPNLMSAAQRSHQVQQLTEQDGQVHKVGQHPHLLSVCHRNSRCVVSDSHRSDLGDWQAHHSCHWGHQGNRVPLPTPVHGSPTGECGLLPEHYDHRMKRRCSHLLYLVSIFPINQSSFNKALHNASHYNID